MEDRSLNLTTEAKSSFTSHEITMSKTSMTNKESAKKLSSGDTTIWEVSRSRQHSRRNIATEDKATLNIRHKV